jgi:hypothetical protein
MFTRSLFLSSVVLAASCVQAGQPVEPGTAQASHTAAAAAAPAYDWGTDAHITLIETTWMPDAVTFQTDAAAGPCPAHHWLAWQGRTDVSNAKDSVKSAYALLLTAYLTGRSVHILGYNPTSGSGPDGCIAAGAWLQ